MPARTAQMVYVEVRELIREWGLGCLGFATVTTAEVLLDVEAERRWRVFRRLVASHWPRSIWVLERQRRGALHWHGVVVVGDDIAEGWDWERFDGGLPFRPARVLREEWAWLRSASTSSGLGRTQLLPLRARGPGVARYITKELGKLQGQILGKRRVRYVGFLRSGVNRRRCSSVFGRLGPGARVWRAHVEAWAYHLGIEDVEGLERRYGSRWGRVLMGTFGGIDLTRRLVGDPEAQVWWRDWCAREGAVWAAAQSARLIDADPF